jgi:uncharacterized membrane protein
VHFPTKEGGALFLAIAAGIVTDGLGFPWWKTALVAALTGVGATAMLRGKRAP